MLIAEQARIKSAFFEDEKNAIDKIIWTAIVNWETSTQIFKHWVNEEELRSLWYEVKHSDLSPTLYEISRD